jgi:hypothetical protein
VETAAHIKGQLAYGSRRDVRYPPERLPTLRRNYHAARLAERSRHIVTEAGPGTEDLAHELTHIMTGTKAQEASNVS